MASLTEHAAAIRAAINAAIADDYYVEFTITQSGGGKVSAVSLDLVGVHSSDLKTPDFETIVEEDWDRGFSG